MMGIRIACFILMVVITPYGWYTWVFGAAAIVLPYIAVVLANVESDVRADGCREPGARTPGGAVGAPASAAEGGPVLRIEETHAIDERRDGSDGQA